MTALREQMPTLGSSYQTFPMLLTCCQTSRQRGDLASLCVTALVCTCTCGEGTTGRACAHGRSGHSSLCYARFLASCYHSGKSYLFWESLSNSMSSNSMPICSCKVCMFSYWLLYFSLWRAGFWGCHLPGILSSMPLPRQQGRSRHCGESSHQTCQPFSRLIHLFSFLVEELKVLLVVEKAATSILEDLVPALLDNAEQCGDKVRPICFLHGDVEVLQGFTHLHCWGLEQEEGEIYVKVFSERKCISGGENTFWASLCSLWRALQQLPCFPINLFLDSLRVLGRGCNETLWCRGCSNKSDAFHLLVPLSHQL